MRARPRRSKLPHAGTLVNANDFELVVPSDFVDVGVPNPRASAGAPPPLPFAAACPSRVLVYASATFRLYRSTPSVCLRMISHTHTDAAPCRAAPGGPPQASPVRVVFKSQDRSQTVYVLVKESSAFKPTFLQVRCSVSRYRLTRLTAPSLRCVVVRGCSVPRARASGAPALCAS